MFPQLICFASLLTTVEMYRDYSSPFNDPCGASATQAHDGDIAYYLTAINNGDRVKRGATSVRERLWPDGRIPFKISPGHHKREWIYEAMRVWENTTCIRFYERPDTHNESYVYFFKGGCCASYVGRQTDDLQQGVSLGSSCNPFSTYLHEIGHAIGFWHEHSRPDRDMYIQVLMQNVNPNARNNYRIVEQINSLGIGYDYNSIMHYSSTAFGGGRTTMEASDPSIPLGVAVDLSDLDILQTNLLYQCDMDNPPPSELPPPPPPAPAPTKPPLPACGQDFTEYEGYFFSPGYPSPYPPNQTCVYRITLPEATRLVIVIVDLHMDWTATCTKDNLTIYKTNDGSDYRQWSRCGGSSVNITIPMEKSIAYVEFISDADNVWEGMRGFAAYYKGEDIDECLEDNGGCSQICMNEVPGYQCLCRRGWFLSGDDHTCFDMNECAVGKGGCEHKCNNTGGSFYCVCPEGCILNSDSRTCSNPEASCGTKNGGCDHNCNESSGGVICSCNSGYRLQSDGVTCRDIDECLINNTCSYGGCRNTDGSYACVCESGYEIDSENSNCINVDECLLGIHLCRGGAQCRDTDGSYECTCRIGYKTSHDGLSCIDVNECLETTCLCSYECVNTIGSYQCICPPGYNLTSVSSNRRMFNNSRSGVNTTGYEDRSGNCSENTSSCATPIFTCDDIDECTLYGGCSHIAGAKCNNSPGSYNCICRPGFILSGSECEDVNECVEGGCSHIIGSVCVNTPGSYGCKCRDGFRLSGSVCKDVDECTNGGCSDIAGTICHNTPGSYECLCNPGYNLSGSHCEGNVTISGGISLRVNPYSSGPSPSFTLICISTGGPATTVTWTRDSIILTEGTQTVLNDAVTATYTHTLVATQCGEYSCSVANNKPSSDTACGVVDRLNPSTILTSLDPAPVIILPINATAVKISWTSCCVPLKFHYWSICNLTGVVITQKTEVLPIGVYTVNVTLDDEFDGYEHRFSLQYITCCDLIHTPVIEEDFTFDKQHFQIQFGPIDYCLSWEVDGKLASIEAQIQSRLIRVIRENCSECFNLTTSFLRKGAFLCRGTPLSATYRSTLVNPFHNTTAANLVGIIQNWVSTRPSMILNGVIVTVNGACPTAVSTLDEEECDGGGHVGPALSQRITQTLNICAIRELGDQICSV